MKIQFWTNVPSPHQAALIRELARLHAVAVIADQEISAERRALGWDAPDYGEAKLVVNPGRGYALALAHADEQTVHIVSGYRGCGTSELVLREAAPGARLGILAENCDARAFLGVLRTMRCRWDVWRNRSRVDFALGMGSLGERWWRSCGFPGNRVFPFGYVMEKPAIVEPQPHLRPSGFRLMYLGRFVECKGFDVLLRALALSKQQEWQADFVASGPLEAKHRRLAASLGISERVRFLAAQRHSEAMETLARMDLLVLPSRYDGWGAVVNEALMRGVPVICTSACGASDLIRHPRLGSVVAANSVEALRGALAEWISRGPRTADHSDEIGAWSRVIEGEPMASYFLNVLEHVYRGGPRPVAPWRVGMHAEAATGTGDRLNLMRLRAGSRGFQMNEGKG